MHLSRHARSVIPILRALVASPHLRWLVAAAVVLGLAATVLGRDDVVRTWHTFLHADLRWIAVALALLLLSLALHAAAVAAVVGAVGGVTAGFRETVSALSIGMLTNAVAPVKLGTVVTPYVLSALLRRRGSHLPFATSLGVVLTERMLAIAAFLLIALALLPVLSAPSWVTTAVLVSTALIAIPVGGGIALNRNRARIAAACERGDRHVRRLRRWLPQIIESQRIWRPRAAAGVIGIQAASCGAQIAAAFAMLAAFHLEPAGLRGAALVVVLTSLIGFVAALPGNIGTFQVAAVTALATYGAAAGPALAFALGLQALQLGVAIAAGLVALSAQNLRLSELSLRSREAAAAMRSTEAGVRAAEEPAGS